MSEIQVGQINSTDGSTAITVSTGNTTLSGSLAMGANNISFSNGNGIDFSASEGSGADSSVLHDYEEGTWTPTAVTGSSTTSGGNYTKTGNVVYINGEIDSLSDTSSTNNVTVSGLPFTVQGGIGFVGGVYGERVDSSLQHAVVRIIGSTTTLDFINGIGTTDFASFIRHNDINNGSDVALRFSGWYFTDS